MRRTMAFVRYHSTEVQADLVGGNTLNIISMPATLLFYDGAEVQADFCGRSHLAAVPAANCSGRVGGVGGRQLLYIIFPIYFQYISNIFPIYLQYNI